ncbi:MAG TPA: hypothetical protein VFU02_16990, partial [Polyangiaceae bacterium]|nr:hypothetical protein [Polyangiaceae bacterium]
VGGVLVLGVCAVLVWEALTLPGPGSSLTSASASASDANPTAAEIAALKPAPDEAASPPEPFEAAPALPAESAEAAAASEPPAPLPAAPLAGVRQVAARPNTFSAPRPRTSAALGPSSGKPQAITDFGGRRY